jgi:hypothetical protein
LAHLLLRGLAEVVSTVPITLPYRFDTSSVWRSILKGAFGLNALLVFSVFYAALVQQQIAKALGVTIIEGVAFVFTRIFVRFQTGSVGTLSSDEVVIEPNALFGVTLPGPHGTYALDRFRAVRVEFRPGPIAPGVQGRPNELVWLVGHPGTPDIVLALTDDRAGRAVGREFGALLRLPVEEVGAPREIRL